MQIQFVCKFEVPFYFRSLLFLHLEHSFKLTAAEDGTDGSDLSRDASEISATSAHEAFKVVHSLADEARDTTWDHSKLHSLSQKPASWKFLELQFAMGRGSGTQQYFPEVESSHLRELAFVASMPLITPSSWATIALRLTAVPLSQLCQKGFKSFTLEHIHLYTTFELSTNWQDPLETC